MKNKKSLIGTNVTSCIYISKYVRLMIFLSMLVIILLIQLKSKKIKELYVVVMLFVDLCY